MRTLILAFVAVAISFGTMACNKKKSNGGTRSGRGYHAGNSPGTSGMGSQAGSGWDALEQLQKSEVRNSNMDNAAYQFLRTSGVPDGEIGNISGNYPTNVVVAMGLKRDSNGYIVESQTRMGLIFWDSYSQNGAPPLTAYFGPEVNTVIEGRITGNNVTVYLRERGEQNIYGTVRIQGYIQGSTFSGEISFNSPNDSRYQTLGQFSLPVNSSIF